jgi:hypothetical protein
MSHDVIPRNETIESRVISKSRVVAGLLAEMDAAGAVIILKSKENTNSISAKMRCEFSVPFENSRISIVGESILQGMYDATALFAGQRINFELTVQDQDGNCAFPAALTVIDLRRSYRRNFSPEVQSAEICGRNAVIFATPIDFSHNSMALVSAASDPPLKKGDNVEIKIRGDGMSRDIYSFPMKVHGIDKVAFGTRILLGFLEASERMRQGNNRQVNRRTLSGVSVCISPLDDHVGEESVCAVIDVSLTGLRCEIKETQRVSWFVPGVHVRLQNSDVHATIMWRTQVSIGLRLDALDESRTLAAWAELLRRLSPGYSFHHSRVDELVGLFTESGLLKGSRRKIYGNKPGKFLPSELVTNNPLLYHRVTSSGEGGRIVGQVSMVRMTDDFWFLQEGTHTGGRGGISYDALLSEIHKTAQDLAGTSLLAPRYVGGLVHKTVKSSVNYLEKFMVDPSNTKFHLMQLGIGLNFTDNRNDCSAVKLLKLSLLNAGSRRTMLNQFTPVIAEVFSGVNGNHCRLNAELAKLGPNHRAETMILDSVKGIWGLAYRLKSYYALSSTGVVNSLYLVIRSGTPTDVIRQGVEAILKSDLARGTDDLVFVIDPMGLHSQERQEVYLETLRQEFPKAKEFMLYIIDSLNSMILV